MQYAHRRRLMVAVIASGTVLVTLAAVGAVGLIRGQQDSARLRPSGPDLHVFFEPMDPSVTRDPSRGLRTLRRSHVASGARFLLGIRDMTAASPNGHR